MISIFQLFAKTDPFVDLFEHCKNTGEAAGVLWDLGVIDKNVINRRDLCLIAALHDLGKCHPVFQRKGLNLVEYIDQLMKECLLPTVDKPNYRHELGTEKALLKRIELFANKDIARAVAKILRLHHQKTDCQKMNCYEEIYPNEKSWLQAQDNLINELQKHFGITLKEIDFIINDANCALVWGIVILADWIVSGGLNDKIGDIFRRKALKPKPIEQMFNVDELRPLQEECQNIIPYLCRNKARVIIIEASMGEGKTEAALYLTANLSDIYGKNGFFIGLPTMATARQMESRVSAFLSDNDAGKALLVHSQAWLDADIAKSEEIDKSWFVPSKRSLLSNYGVGTVDQAMMSVLRIKHGVLRLLGLSGKVFIIDEAHAYDTYMQTIIYRLLNWCESLNIPVIILSATLPKERKRQIIKACGCDAEIKSDAYPLITIAGDDGKLYEHAVEGSYIERELLWENIEFTEHKDIAHKALETIKDGGCACVIMNTVKDAQKVFEAAQGFNSDAELNLFHARFLLKDRKVIENDCLSKFGKNSASRPKKALLVATQVVEQSLDVDFDYMISALAPIDLLLQRSGRIHRHDRERPKALSKPRITVIINKEEINDSGIGGIYHTWILRQTQRTIKKIEGSVRIPNDIRLLIEEVYDTALQQQLSDEDLQHFINLKSIEELDKGMAKEVIFPVPSDDWFFPLEDGGFFDEAELPFMREGAHTRIGSNEIKIALLPHALWNEDNLADSDKDYAIKVLDYTVSVIIPQGCQLPSKGSLFKCGGYLKGVYAIEGEDSFNIEYYKNGTTVNKRYSINAIYGLKEEK